MLYMEGERRVEESKYYKFEVVKDKLPKRGNKIDWMNVKDIYIYCVNLNSTYKLKVIDRKRNARGELYLYLSYNNVEARTPIRSNSLGDGKVSSLFKELGIIRFLTVGEIDVVEKRCNKCNIIKSINEFGTSKWIKDGYENTCKKCREERRKKYNKKCEVCNKEYVTSDSKSRFCGAVCAASGRRNRVKVNCEACGKVIEVISSKYKTNNKFFCNMECRRDYYNEYSEIDENREILDGEKRCNKCGKIKSINEFREQRNTCKECNKNKSKERVRTIKITEKKCNKCNEVKPISEFYKASTKDGYQGQCKACHKIYSKINECICQYCGKKFYSDKKEGKFCSHKCSSDFTIVHNKRHCEICNKLFKPKNESSRYCSVECRRKGSVKEREKLICAYCGVEFERLKSQINGKNNCCSVKCKNKLEEILYSGENSHAWNPNKPIEEREKERKYPEYYEWRKKVYSRDGFTCQCCGDDKGGNLVAHHYINYMENVELRTDINIGITLCNICHKKFHDIYGYTNNNKTQFEEFMSKIYD